MRKLLVLILLPISALVQKDTSFWFAAPDANQALTGNSYDCPILLRVTTFSSPSTVTVSIPANPSFSPNEMPVGSPTRFLNPAGKFQLGFLNGATSFNSSGCHFGFFSDFKSGTVTRSKVDICRLDSAQLNAIGGVKYQWSPSTGLSNIGIANPKASPNTTMDYRVVIMTADGCADSAFVKVVVKTDCNPVLPPCIIDFSYRQDVCNPNSIQFNSIGDLPLGTYWNFGDGNTTLNNPSPTHTYATAGNFIVRYGFQNADCFDTVTKIISVNVVPENIILTPDTTICFGATKQLSSTPSLKYCWSPTTYLNNPLAANPITSTQVPITYYLNAEVQGSNVINNGNFSAGNTGFTSEYTFAANNTTEGQYFVGNSPQNWNVALSNCTDHTTGNGAMMMVNGSPAPNVKVWTQTVPVTPNTNYAFSSWIQALFPPNPAKLSFSINGADLGSLITASLPTCNWTQFYTTWNSGSNTSANISIVNKNTIVLGNDFALDDISFAPVFIKRDSVKINIDKPRVITRSDTAICQGSSVQLNTSGAASYSWTPPNSLSNPAIADPIAAPTIFTQYIVTGTTVNGCVAKDTVNVTVNALPTISASSTNSVNCLNPSSQLSATGAASYSWSPGATLSNPAIANPIATPAISTQYIVTGTAFNGCRNTTSVTVNVGAAHQSDFSFVRNVCNPLDVTFQTSPANFTTVQWSFGDGITSSGTATISHTYPTFGNYTVTMIQTYGVCRDTVTKQISVAVQNDPMLIQTADTTICYGLTKQVRSQPALSYCWTPSTYLNNPASQNPITSTPTNIIYYLTSEVPGINVITNGNFSAGNIGFTSEYSFAGNNTTEGEYFVGSNPQNWNVALSNCTDHTTGNGMMLLVNGSPTPNVKVWTQNVPVTPNTNYAFSSWIQALYTPNPAQLGFSINGSDIGTLISASLPTCTWSQFYTTWNSGSNTSALISIVNKNTFVQGNDFALDDISFAPVVIKRDSVKIKVDTPRVRTIADTATCKGTPIQLTSTGASTYSWSPATGLSSASTGSPVATPADTTQYILTGTNAFGCTSKDSVMVYVKKLPIIGISNDDTICTNQSAQLLASGGTQYSWSPSTTLNNGTIPNPVASPTSNITYTVLVTGSNNCFNKDSVDISIRPLPNFSISVDKSTCVNGKAQLSATGGTSYVWSPATYLNNAAIATPVATVPANTMFTVNITDAYCNLSAVLTTNVLTNLAKPVITALKANDIDCVFSSAQLNASGANAYVWSPAIGLSNSTIANPIATPSVTQQYTVTGTDTVNNCKSEDTLTVFIKGVTNPKSYIPNAFTPNGDGSNDCFRVKDFGTVKIVDIIIFNRWGNLVFQTKNPSECWDGKYKGQPAEPGNYVYYIQVLNDCGQELKKGNLLLLR